MNTKTNYPDPYVTYEWAYSNPQQFERKAPITVSVIVGQDDIPYEISVFLDHHSQYHLHFITSRDDTTIKPVYLIAITDEAYRDTSLVQAMLVNAVSEYDKL